jgi:hypothetical protein
MANPLFHILMKFRFGHYRKQISIKKKYIRQSEGLMLLVREMIEMAYLYEGDTDKFYRKFMETINIKSLREHGLIDPDMLLHSPRYNRMCSELKGEDAELWALREAGFTTRELKMVYGHTNINSVYVKVNRLKKRLERKMQELRDDQNRRNGR